MSQTLIHIRDLHKSFGSLEVLKGIDIDVRQGERIAIIGSSGSGKSTLLNIIAGLDEPDTGTITINGRDVTHVPPQKRDTSSTEPVMSRIAITLGRSVLRFFQIVWNSSAWYSMSTRMVRRIPVNACWNVAQTWRRPRLAFADGRRPKPPVFGLASGRRFRRATTHSLFQAVLVMHPRLLQVSRRSAFHTLVLRERRADGPVEGGEQ